MAAAAKPCARLWCFGASRIIAPRARPGAGAGNEQGRCRDHQRGEHRRQVAKRLVEPARREAEHPDLPPPLVQEVGDYRDGAEEGEPRKTQEREPKAGADHPAGERTGERCHRRARLAGAAAVEMDHAPARFLEGAALLDQQGHRGKHGEPAEGRRAAQRRQRPSRAGGGEAQDRDHREAAKESIDGGALRPV